MPEQKLIFLLGRTPELAAAELSAVLPEAKLAHLSPDVVLADSGSHNPAELLARLGGTVKIGELIASRFTPAAVADDLARNPMDGKVLFGLSQLGPKTGAGSLKAGLEIKRLLKAKGLNARLVTSKSSHLPAAAINRHGAVEYIVLPDGQLARTLVAQDVDDFTRRDVGRPHRDIKSGTLPPKVARMMVNLARVPAGGVLLDPFCGSGTVLTEAILAGVTSVIGTDISPKAVTESQANLQWLQQHYPQAKSAQWSVINGDVRQLAEVIGDRRVDAIVTEPYLGPPRRGRETRATLHTVISELADLYLAAFVQIARVLKPGGRVVVALPEFVFGREVLAVPIQKEIERLGWRLQAGPFAYARADQLVRRQIGVWIGVA